MTILSEDCMGAGGKFQAPCQARCREIYETDQLDDS
jgi:hypothetical protein